MRLMVGIVVLERWRCILMIERVEVLTHVTQRHTCAVTSQGGAMCWGYNYYGQVMHHELQFVYVVHFSVASCLGSAAACH